MRDGSIREVPVRIAVPGPPGLAHDTPGRVSARLPVAGCRPAQRQVNAILLPHLHLGHDEVVGARERYLHVAPRPAYPHVGRSPCTDSLRGRGPLEVVVRIVDLDDIVLEPVGHHIVAVPDAHRLDELLRRAARQVDLPPGACLGVGVRDRAVGVHPVDVAVARARGRGALEGARLSVPGCSQVFRQVDARPRPHRQPAVVAPQGVPLLCDISPVAAHRGRPQPGCGVVLALDILVHLVVHGVVHDEAKRRA